MVNKKGYIKTLEAVIAIIMIIVISYTLIPQHVERPPDPPLVLQDAMKFINKEIELDEDLRLNLSKTSQQGSKANQKIVSIVEKYKPINYDFTCAICKFTHTCYIGSLPFEKNVYVTDVFIASNKKKQDPRIVRIWFWESTGQTIDKCEEK